VWWIAVYVPVDILKQALSKNPHALGVGEAR
jgi:hypothetical protein